MALDSLASASIVSSLSTQSQTVLNTVFTDTNNGDLKNTSLVAGTLLTSTGSGGIQQGALITNSNSPLVTTLTMGGAGETKITVPGGAGNVVAFESSPSPSPFGTVVADLTNKASQAYGTDVTPGNGTNGILTGLKLIQSGQIGDPSLITGNYNTTILYTGGASANTIVGGTGNSLLSLDHIGTGGNINIVAGSGQDSVIGGANSPIVQSDAGLIMGTGNVTIVAGSGNSTLGGDKGNQAIVGGIGNDYLIGGGGRDTLTGGAGKDVFIFDAVGHYTVTDFQVGVDTLGFTSLSAFGINSLHDILSKITSATNNGGNAEIKFGTESSITLIGVSVQQLQTDFIKFFTIN